jgi:FKBP-type peptidyl-prolyl cis-trans isomerase 2
MAEPKPPRTLAIVLVLVVIIAGAAGAGVLYYENHKLGTPHELTVQIGDNVTVNYIGVFGSSAQIGKVFDTSEYAVATNNLSWPKAIGFTPRGPYPSNFTPLPVAVGPNVPSGGYTVGNLTFSGVVTGFWQGLIGLPGNQTRYITVPQNLGYGPQNSSCLVSQPLTYTLPVTVALSTSAFTTQFPSVTPAAGAEFTDPTYQWPVYILSVNSTSVVYENLPTLGWTASPQGWAVKVTNITSTNITLVNQLSAVNAGLVGGTSTTQVCNTGSFIVSAVNAATGTYVENYNEPVTGQTLIFIVSVVDIFPPGT